jgi:hypothetical protein
MASRREIHVQEDVPGPGAYRPDYNPAKERQPAIKYTIIFNAFA